MAISYSLGTLLSINESPLIDTVHLQAASHSQAMGDRDARELIPEPGLHFSGASLEGVPANTGATDQGVAPEGSDLCQHPQ